MNLQTQRHMLERFLEKLSEVKTEKLGPADQKAFFINAYNAWTLWLVLTRYPSLTSIKDLGSLFSTPWNQKIVKVEGKTLTLEEVEYIVPAHPLQGPAHVLRHMQRGQGRAAAVG